MDKQTKPNDAELRARLTPEQYHVTQEKGTERAFTGQYWNHREDGKYHCIVCGELLFDSSTKFDSGCGWPSFYQQVTPEAIDVHSDHSHGMVRDEIVCTSAARIWDTCFLTGRDRRGCATA